MNLINTILILLIIIYLINYLTNGNIINTFSNYSSLCKNKIENFMDLSFSNTPKIPFTSQLDFPYMNNDSNDIFDSDTYNLYNFINSLIKPNINIMN